MLKFLQKFKDWFVSTPIQPVDPRNEFGFPAEVVKKKPGRPRKPAGIKAPKSKKAK